MSRAWSIEVTLELIEKYEQYPCLWDTRLKEYRDRDAKAAAIRALAEHFKTTSEEINRKIHNLRTQLAQETRKIKNKKSGSGVDGVYCSKWPFFNAMQFLNGASTSRQGMSNMNDENDGKEPALEEANVDDREEEMPTQEKQPSKRRKREEKQSGGIPEELIRKAQSVLEEPEDEYAIFGKFVASEMRAFRSDESRRRLKLGIQRLLLEVGEAEFHEQRDQLYNQQRLQQNMTHNQSWQQSWTQNQRSDWNQPPLETSSCQLPVPPSTWGIPNFSASFDLPRYQDIGGPNTNVQSSTGTAGPTITVAVTTAKM